MSDSVRPHTRQPTRLRRPWDSPGTNTGVGCHFLLQCMKVKSESEVAQSCPTLSDPHGLQPTRLLHPWDFPGKSTGVGCHCLLRIEKLQDCKQLTSLSRVPGEATKGRNSLNYEITHRGHHSKVGVSGCRVPLVTLHYRGRAQDPGLKKPCTQQEPAECRTSLRGKKTLSSPSGFLVPSTGKV